MMKKIADQKSCSHDNKKKIYIKFGDKLIDRLEILLGNICDDCDRFIPSKVYNRYRPELNKYCARCDGEVEFAGYNAGSSRNGVYIYYECKLCHCKQREFC